MLIYSVNLALQINQTKFKVHFLSPYNCASCEKVLKNAFFQSSEFEIFLKNISWIKKAEKTLKWKPIFDDQNMINESYDSWLEQNK